MEGRVVLICLAILAFFDVHMVYGNAAEIQTTFGGKWKAYKGENVENFLKENGMNLVMRTAAAKATPTTMTITIDGDNVTIKIEAMVKTIEESFKLGAEVARKNDDGKDVKSLMTYADGKLTIVNTPVDPKLTPATVTREIVNGELVQTMTRNGVTGKRFFKKA